MSELVLRGIFLLRREELAWFYQGGCSWMFPEAFEEFRKLIPPEERGDMIAAYYRRLTHPDRDVQIAAATRLVGVGGQHAVAAAGPRARASCSAPTPTPSPSPASSATTSSTAASSSATTSCCAAWSASATCPACIVHGRYDVVTPVKNAWDL